MPALTSAVVALLRHDQGEQRTFTVSPHGDTHSNLLWSTPTTTNESPFSSSGYVRSPNNLPLPTSTAPAPDCVSCSELPDVCPLLCDAESTCVISTQTCEKCPEFYCRSLKDSTQLGLDKPLAIEAEESMAASSPTPTYVPVDSAGRTGKEFTAERGAAIGGIIGGVLGLVLASIIAWYIVNRYVRNKRDRDRDEAEAAADKWATKDPFRRRRRTYHIDNDGPTTYDDGSGSTFVDIEHAAALQSRKPTERDAVSSPQNTEVSGTIYFQRRPDVGYPRPAPPPPAAASASYGDNTGQAKISPQAVSHQSVASNSRGLWQERAISTSSPYDALVDFDMEVAVDLPTLDAIRDESQRASSSTLAETNITAAEIAKNQDNQSSEHTKIRHSHSSSEVSGRSRMHGLTRLFGRDHGHEIDRTSGSAAKSSPSGNANETRQRGSTHMSEMSSEGPSIQVSIDRTTTNSFNPANEIDLSRITVFSSTGDEPESSFDISEATRSTTFHALRDANPFADYTEQHNHGDLAHSSFGSELSAGDLNEFSAYAAAVSTSSEDNQISFPAISANSSITEPQRAQSSAFPPAGTLPPGNQNPMASMSTLIFEDSARLPAVTSAAFQARRVSKALRKPTASSTRNSKEEKGLDTSYRVQEQPKNAQSPSIPPRRSPRLGGATNPLESQRFSECEKKARISTSVPALGPSNAPIRPASLRSVMPPPRPPRPEVSPFDSDYLQEELIADKIVPCETQMTSARESFIDTESLTGENSLKLRQTLIRTSHVPQVEAGPSMNQSSPSSIFSDGTQPKALYLGRRISIPMADPGNCEVAPLRRTSRLSEYNEISPESTAMNRHSSAAISVTSSIYEA